MEFANSIGGTGLRPLIATSTLSVASLRHSCDRGDVEMRRECFRYFPQMVMPFFSDTGSSIDEMIRLCQSFSRASDRRACIFGIGVAKVNKVYVDPGYDVKLCESFNDLRDKKSCVLGVISSAVGYGKYGTVQKYCGFLAPQELKHVCYEAMFYTMNQLGRRTPAEKPEAFCVDSMCQASSSSYDRELEDTILGR